MPVYVNPENDTFYLSGGNSSYVLHQNPEHQLLNLYWGARIADNSIRYDPGEYIPTASFDLPASLVPWEIPCCGSGWYGVPAVGVQNDHGDDYTDLKVTSFNIIHGKPALTGLPAVYTESSDEAETVSFLLEDRLTGLAVKYNVSVFTSSGAITRSLIIINKGDLPVRLTSVLSASVPLWESGFDVIHLKGAWARERSFVRSDAGQAEYRISSSRGASGHEENPFLALCEKNTDEFSGSVWGMSLVYSGSFHAYSSLDNANHIRFGIGLNPEVFSWILNPGESFQSPEAVLVYSAEGFNGMSQIYHKLYRTRLCRGKWRDRERPILVNNWEGTYFDFTEEKLLSIAEKAAQLGIELFVLDDGWFGRRNSDSCSLGDWTVNQKKLPSGIKGLSDRIHHMGLKFGLWFEPEMISPDSDLYRSHPDWCLHIPGRPRTQARNQLVLDLVRPEVRNYIIRSVSGILSSGSVDYVKWDMNRNMTEAFSEALPPDRRKETQHRYMLGLYSILETLTSSFPDILFESCSGGGGRFDPGMLFYMPQTWTSDDTDAVERLKIQYGTSVVYPLSAAGAHVSAVPNHQTGRTTSMKMRCDTALSGVFGFELDLGSLSPQEFEEAGKMVEYAKSVRELTSSGVFWRLKSPFDSSYTAWAFVSEDRRQILLSVFRSLCTPNTPAVHIRLHGICRDAWYISDDGIKYHGSVLSGKGISVSLRGDFSSRVIFLRMA